MRLCVFGLGYVGTVTAACFAEFGHDVVGVDPNAGKVASIARGEAPVVEPELGALVARTVRGGRLRATADPAAAMTDAELSLVCVGTPSLANGNLDTQYLVRVCEQIGTALRDRASPHTVVIRSTVLPGTMRDVVVPALERSSGRKAHRDFALCLNPEFLREGSALNDFRHPPKTVIGEASPGAGAVLAALYRGVDAPVFHCAIEVAEMAKYADNAWHALKVVFANEIGAVCKGAGIDSHRVMDIFCQDRKLNISPAYLRPGFAFGGSCLPKDLRALTYKARSLDVQVPVLSAILPSNDLQVERGLQMILAKGRRRIGLLGLSFKAGTDDLRESPLVEIAERLLGKGCELLIYDRSVNIAALTGANRDYILRTIPHIARLMVDSIDAVMAHAEVIVIGNGDPEFREVPDNIGAGQMLVDFVRIQDRPGDRGAYDGIGW